MKTHTSAVLIAAILLGAAISRAQEVSVETPKQQAETPQADKKLRDEERAKALLEKKPVTYGGFLVDAARAEKKSRFLSLRQPRDAKNDTKNVAVEERTGRPRGFVLFRVEF